MQWLHERTQRAGDRMTEALQRPRQVTVAVGIGLVGCLVLVIGLFDTMAHTRTVDARDGIADFLATSPGDGLGLSIDQVLEIWRVVLLLSGALAAAAFVMGIFVIQRHNGARIGFTVAAGLLLLAMPAIGVFPVIVAVAAVWLWSEPARDWFAGRAPRPKATPEPPRVTVEPPTAGAPPPSAYPFGTAPQQQAPPPSQQPAHPPPVVGSWPPPSPQLIQPPAVMPAAPPPHERPTSVLWAVILTWVFAGLTAVTLGLGIIALATSRAEFETRLQEQIESDAQLRSLGLTAAELMPFVWTVCVGSLIWSLAAILVAYLAFRRLKWARIVLAVSASGAALLSLIGILGILPIFTLVPSAAAVVLLFTRSANAWYSRAPGVAAPPVPRDRPW
jgi:FtsH-binding integral membrane protein